MGDNKLVAELERRLEEFQLRVQPRSAVADALESNMPLDIRLSHQGSSADYALLGTANSALTREEVQRAGGQNRRRPLLLAPRIGEQSAQELRRRGVNYLDAAGNAHFEFDGVFIDVRGRSAGKDAGASVPRTRSGRSSRNLFSAKRAQVIFTLLTWPKILDGSVREIAEVAGVSVGQAQQTLKDLEAQYFVPGTRIIPPPKRRKLIDLWVDSYPTGLGAANSGIGFQGDVASFDPTTSGALVSGEAASAHLKNPQTLTLYLAGDMSGLVIANRWVKSSQGANIYVRNKFWRTPVFAEAESAAKNTVPPLLVLADLLASGDERQREAAEELRREIY